MTRLTNGLSKKWENHKAATLLADRLLQLLANPGITDHVWTISDLLLH
jgi:hypothetical protein